MAWILAAAPITNTEISNTGWCLLHHGSLDAVVYLHPTATHISLTLEQQIANELGGNLLGRAAKKGLGGAERCWEVVVALGVAMYGSAEEC